MILCLIPQKLIENIAGTFIIQGKLITDAFNMVITGNIRKMQSSLEDVVRYNLILGNEQVPLNDLLGKMVRLEYLHKINCIRCGRETKKSFAQGYCYPCFISSPETEECVLHPEKCRAQEGRARDMEYAREHCLIEHVVYLSVTSGVKVGVTRHTQVPVRWIDQGAVRVIELARTPNRYTAGLIEVSLKATMDDKTNWRRMLSGDVQDDIPLPEIKSDALVHFPEDLKQFYILENIELSIRYPVDIYPEKISSLDFEKTSRIDGVLTGIKGQYLMFDGGRVINIRKYGGYLIRAEI